MLYRAIEFARVLGSARLELQLHRNPPHFPTEGREREKNELLAWPITAVGI
jgi:hypothetical protein